MSEVYEQVIITCTTINIFIFISGVISLAGLLISDYVRKRKKKKRDREGKE